MIIDCHAHVFPYLGGASGYDSVASHMTYFQKEMCTPNPPVRRVRDHAIVEEPTLWDGKDPSVKGLSQVSFRVGRFGRIEWTKDGVDYYIYWMPPSLQEMTAPPELMLAHMDYIGVDKAVLQNGHPYGRLNDYFAQCIQRYPGRFIGLAQVDETKADTPEEMADLHRSVYERGLRGLYYETNAFFLTGYRDHFDDPRFAPFWDEVRRLGLVVFMDLRAVPLPTAANYLEQIRRLDRWLQRYPEVPTVLPVGFPFRLFREGAGFRVPREVLNVLRHPNLHVEVCYPIYQGRWWEYPYVEAQPLIRELYQEFGPTKLLWGSDMPNVERHCTYAQCLDYLRVHCDFIAPKDMELILGGNVARIFGLSQ